MKNLEPIQTISIDLEHQQIELESHRYNISALGFYEQHLIIGTDEGASVWVGHLKDKPIDTQESNKTSVRLILLDQVFHLSSDPHHEIDVEAIHCYQHHCFVLGSHSLKRKKVKSSLTQQENRKRIQKVSKDHERFKIFKLSLSKSPFSIEKIIDEHSIQKALQKDPILAPFSKIPSKENGIDMEAMAINDDHIFLGFRSPVLRQNLVPIWVSDHKFKHYKLNFVDLKGDGIRDMVTVKNGILILSGPSNDRQGAFHIYFWNGQDGIPGSDINTPVTNCLGRIEPKHPAYKAEAIAVMKETDNAYHIIIAYDGAEYGAPEIYQLDKTVFSKN